MPCFIIQISPGRLIHGHFLQAACIAEAATQRDAQLKIERNTGASQWATTSHKLRVGAQVGSMARVAGRAAEEESAALVGEVRVLREGDMAHYYHIWTYNPRFYSSRCGFCGRHSRLTARRSI